MNVINKILIFFISLIPKTVIRLFSKKYIAGETIPEVIQVVKKLNDKGIMTTVDALGENIRNKSEAEKVVELYKDLLKKIDQNGLNATISLKPTHLGLKLDKQFCYRNIYAITDFAANLTIVNIF